MVTEIKIKNLVEGFQSIITNGKHSIVGDEPISSKGTDLGMTPIELLLSGLGMCKVATIRSIARMKNWEVGEVNAVLSQEIIKNREGFKTNIKVALSIEGDITEDQKQELLKQADNCYVHRMIMGNWNIENAVELKK